MLERPPDPVDTAGVLRPIDLGTMKVLKIRQYSQFFVKASKGPYVKFKYYSYATYLVLFFFMGALLIRNLVTVQSLEILNS